jgi:hypothetical protein
MLFPLLFFRVTGGLYCGSGVAARFSYFLFSLSLCYYCFVTSSRSGIYRCSDAAKSISLLAAIVSLYKPLFCDCTSITTTAATTSASTSQYQRTQGAGSLCVQLFILSTDDTPFAYRVVVAIIST